MSALNIGARALNANLAALQAIGNNIANVNTPGYSRQNVIQQTSGYQQMGNGFFGKGMEIATVERSHNAYLTREAQMTGSVAAADALRYARLQQLESAFPTGTAGLGAALNDMLNAWSDVSSSPGNLTARVVVIAKGEELASRLRNTASQIDALQQTTQQQVAGTVKVINGLAQDLARINTRITESQGSGHTPNDLLDQRDQILRELNKHVQTTNVPADDGSVSVFVAGSQPLVLGSRANALATGSDSTDSSRIALSFVQGGVSTPISDASLGGGELAGLMRFMNEDLVDTQNLLGRMALATATTVNNQHTLGVDLRGNPGQNFFVPPPAAQGLPVPGNTGNATISAGVADPTALIASDYEVRFEAGGISVVRLSDGTSTPVPALPAVIDGLTFNVDAGAAAVGDRFPGAPLRSRRAQPAGRHRLARPAGRGQPGDGHARHRQQRRPERGESVRFVGLGQPHRPGHHHLPGRRQFHRHRPEAPATRRPTTPARRRATTTRRANRSRSTAGASRCAAAPAPATASASALHRRARSARTRATAPACWPCATCPPSRVCRCPTAMSACSPTSARACRGRNSPPTSRARSPTPPRPRAPTCRVVNLDEEAARPAAVSAGLPGLGQVSPDRAEHLRQPVADRGPLTQAPSPRTPPCELPLPTVTTTPSPC